MRYALNRNTFLATPTSPRLLIEGAMASLPVPDEAVYLHESVVRGHHVYKRVWSPVVGEILQLSCEDDNDHDRFSVSVMKAELVVGHVPRRLSRTVWHFLRHCGKATCEVTGRRKFGNGLEVPCLYRFVGKERLVRRLKGLLQRSYKSDLPDSCPHSHSM